ncbi:50S ribosomal protein L24 [Fibrobacterota bacterium]
MSIKFKKEDLVKVISGKSKGAQGKIIRVLRDKNAVLVEGLNRAKKHEKPNRKNEQGGIVEREMPIHISNIMLINTKSNQPVKVARKKNDKGKRVRVEKKNPGNILD